MDDPTLDARFLEFWSYYPVKQAKRDAIKAWGQARITDDEWLQILTALDWQTRSEQWEKGFIPLPATYLRGRRWEDEPRQAAAPMRRDIPMRQEWRCPHQPAHCSRWACERQQALDEAEAAS